MNERGINLIDLPKATQNKIESLNVLVDDLNRLKSIDEVDIEEEELEEIENIEKEINELESIILKKIEQFDPVKYAKSLEKVKLMADLKKQNKKNKDEEDSIKESASDEVLIKESSENKDDSKLEALAYISKMIPVQENVQESVQKIDNQDFVENKNNIQSVEEEEYEDEFEKIGEAKPKKLMNKGWILMGVGFLFLTWGAVNVFKNKRG